jgi:hypothetical protein
MRALAAETSKPENLHPWGDRSIPPVPLSKWSGEVRGYLGGPMGDHCAAWHPDAALAVADWLDAAGADLWAHGPLCCADGCMECDDDLWAPHVRRALAVARAFLGSES